MKLKNLLFTLFKLCCWVWRRLCEKRKCFMVLDIHLKIIDLDCGDIHSGICPISSAEWHGKKITGCHSVLQNSINTAEYSLMLNSFCSPKQPITILRTHLKPRLHHWRLYYSLHPLTPKISIEILLTVCHIVLEMLVWRIWSWSN